MSKPTRCQPTVYVQPSAESVLLKCGNILIDVAKAMRSTADLRPTQADELIGCCSMLAEVSGRLARMAPEPPRVQTPPSLVIVQK